MDRNRKIFVGALLVAAGCLFVLSCGDDGTTNPSCTNCDYWEKAFGRSGRYPMSCPADPNLIAFSDTMDLMGSTSATEMYYHIWVARRADTTRYFQITSGPAFDLRPVWSPDGTKIAFERGAAGARDIYVVDVSDLENPGEPVRFTDNSVLEESNTSASWVTVNGSEQWISFTNSSNGGSDLDIVRMAYPTPGDPVWVTVDPADFAEEQNGVLAYIFRDKQSASNGSGLVTFASPDRIPVGDLYVVARSEEEEDTSLVHARVFINGKDSGDSTPVLFEYRPVQDSVLIQGQLEGYCSTARLDFTGMQPDTLNTTILNFVHTHGTLAAASLPGGVHAVFVGTVEWSAIPIPEEEDSVVVDTVWVEQFPKTPDFDPQGDPEYAFYSCIRADTILVYAATPYGPCSDTLEVEVTAGDTSWVLLDCGGSSTVVGAPSFAGARRPMPVLQQQPEPYTLWAVDVDSEALYALAHAAEPISNPALSPDGRYIAYIRGQGAERELVVSGDVLDFIAGTAAIETRVIGLPGSAEDIECYRFPERVSWVYDGTRSKVVASLSVCRGGDLTEDYEVWIGDLSDLLP